jgi:rhamnosyl/mannosyltransferase
VIKVLQLTKFYPPFWGGIEAVTYELTERLRLAGYHCDVLCANTALKTVKEHYNQQYYVTRAASFGRLFSTSLSFSLIAELRKIHHKYAIIHVHLPDPLTALALFIVNPKCKIIIHWHSDIIKQKYLLKIFLPIQHWLLKRADAIIGTSPKYIQESTQLKGYLHKCVAIPIGSALQTNPTDEAVDLVKQKYRNKKIVFALGRLVYYKGFTFLIDAAKKLSDNYVVVIGGTGPLEKKLKRQIKRNALQDKVFLAGRISIQELPAYYQACFVLCFPSTHPSEAFGVTQIEAMSFGKPVISTEIPRSGVSWVNQHLQSGLVIEKENADAIAQAIQKLGNDTALYHQLSEQAKQRYQIHFKPEQMIQKVADLYYRILPQSKTTGNKHPKISIITVLLDNKNYIQDAIESVFSQTYKNIEYIIIDGGSKDGSLQIIEKYKDRLAHFISEPDNGVYDALNKGISMASGDIIGLLHSDDFFEDEHVIETIVNTFNNTDCDAIYGDLKYVDNNNRNKVVRVWYAGNYLPNLFYKGWMPPHPTFYAKAEVYKKHGVFNTTLKFAADYELMLRFILKAGIKTAYINSFLVRMRVGGTSNRSLLNRLKANIEDRKAWRINGLKPGLLTLLLKPFSKISQYRF